jgi:Bifunctional DNA primase/polymerase, N-terminal
MSPTNIIDHATNPSSPTGAPRTEETPTPLAAALAYARRGWRVFPVHTPTGDRERPCSCQQPGCDDPGKNPRTKRGCHDATTDEAQIREWWGRWASANIGIATGLESGLWVLDVDGARGEQTLAELESAHGRLPETAEQVTGSGGRHVVFRYTAGLKNRVRFAPGLDVRTDGGYVVAAPSLHVSGRRYAWEVSGDVPLA